MKVYSWRTFIKFCVLYKRFIISHISLAPAVLFSISPSCANARVRLDFSSLAFPLFCFVCSGFLCLAWLFDFCLAYNSSSPESQKAAKKQYGLGSFHNGINVPVKISIGSGPNFLQPKTDGSVWLYGILISYKYELCSISRSHGMFFDSYALV